MIYCIIDHGLNFKDLFVFVFFLSIPVISYFDDIRAIDELGNNLETNDKLKLNDELSKPIVSEPHYSLTDNYILDFYDDIILKYEDVLLIYGTTISTGRNSRAKSVVLITKDGEYNIVTSGIGAKSRILEAYNIIKEKNPNVLEGLSKENVKKVEEIRYGQSNVNINNNHDRYRIIGWILMLVSIIWFFYLFTKMDISLWFIVFLLLFISGIVLIMKK